MLLESRRAMLRDAGYTYYISYQSYRPITELWCDSGYPTTPDALVDHLRSLEQREQAGEVRNIEYIIL